MYIRPSFPYSRASPLLELRATLASSPRLCSVLTPRLISFKSSIEPSPVLREMLPSVAFRSDAKGTPEEATLLGPAENPCALPNTPKVVAGAPDPTDVAPFPLRGF